LLHMLVKYCRITVQKLMRFERKLYGPTKFLDGTWRIKTNEELDTRNLIEHTHKKKI
jgi:hypothetical protein